GDQRDSADAAFGVMRGEPGKRPVPGLGPRPGALPSPVLLTGPAAAFQQADRLVRLEQRLVVGEHLADGRLGARRQPLGPYPGWRGADMGGSLAAIKPGQAAVKAAEGAVRGRKGGTDRG